MKPDRPTSKLGNVQEDDLAGEVGSQVDFSQMKDKEVEEHFEQLLVSCWLFRIFDDCEKK